MLAFITLDSLINGSSNWVFELLIGLIFTHVLPLAWQLFTAPFLNPSMLWIITPLLISMILMQLYFARHRKEKLGWSSAFGNSISLIFVSVNLLQVLYNDFGLAGVNPFNPLTNKFYLVLGIGLMSVIQLIINFYHLIPEKIAFFMNSAVPTNMTAYIAISFIYTDIPLTWVSLSAYVLLVGLMIFFFKQFAKLVPMSEESILYIKQEAARKAQEKANKLKRELRQERAADAKLNDSFIMIGSIILALIILIIVRSFVVLPIWVTPLVQSVTFIVSVIVLLLVRGLNLKNLNFDGELGEVLVGFVSGLGLFFIITGVVYLLWFMVPHADSLRLLAPAFFYESVSPWLLVLVLGLLVPLGAELFFRGVIQRSLKSNLGSVTGVVIQAVLASFIMFSFSILNGLVSGFMFLTPIVLFIAYLLLGFLRDKWGLESSVTAHVTFNLVGIILFLVTV